jgi:polar amino acid transport system permease protein
MVLTILSGIWLTLGITAMSLVLGAILGLPITLARRSNIAVVRVAAAAYIDIVRSIPPITWLFLIYFGLPQYAIRMDSLTAAVVGFSVIASAFFAEIYRSGLLGIDRGQWEAATALGLTPFDALRHIITPQALKIALPAAAAYAIALLKDSALASTIGVHDLTYQATVVARSTQQGLLSFTIAGLAYIAVSIPLAIAARRVDRGLRARLEIS